MHFKSKLISIICLPVILVVLVVGVGITYARYRSTNSETIIFETKLIGDSGTITISSQDGWQQSGDSLSLDFTLSGGKAKTNRKAYLRLTATENFDSSAEVTLTVDGVQYKGVASDVKKGELLHFQMGEGTEYRFMNNGQELYWQLSDSERMTLTVEGEGNKSLLRLVAKEK